MKKFEKKVAIRLRKKGLSLSEISRRLTVSKSTASVWVKKVELSPDAKEKLLAKTKRALDKAIATNKAKKQRKVDKIKSQIKITFRDLKINSESAKIYCALLYWGEGSKGASTTVFTNSDPVMIATYLKLIRLAFKLDENKFRVCLHLHAYHNERKQKNFWSQITGIPKKQFIKVYKKKTGISTKVGYEGCVSVRYHDVNILFEMTLLQKYLSEIIGV